MGRGRLLLQRLRRLLPGPGGAGRGGRLAAGLLAGLGCLAAAAFVGSGRHEELLARALPLALEPRDPPAAEGPPPPPADAEAFALQPPAGACGPPGRPPLVLALVASATGHAERRQAVRRTWGSWGGPWGALRTFFVVGLPGEAGAQAALGREAARHGDLIQGRFADTYGNLTLKTLALLRWAAARCPHARFVLKADDDVFVNAGGLARHLAALRQPRRLYLGRLHWRVRPSRQPRSRHHVPAALYPPDVFPPYCSGTAYVLSADAVPALLAAARHVPRVPVEDAFVGLCARRAGIAPRHSVRMAGSTRFPADPCCYREVLFSVHGVAPAQMLDMWGRREACTFLQRTFGILRCRLLAWLAPAR